MRLCPRSGSSPWLLAAALLLLAVPAGAADPPDGVSLTVTRGPGGSEVTLTWSGGTEPYRVYRSATAAAITDAGSYLGEAVSTVWVDAPPAGKVAFYRVVMCTAGTDCVSGFCADGWCCDGPCGASCEACNVAGSEGACSFIPPSADPDNECPGIASCNGAGGCAPNYPNGSLCGGDTDCASGFCTDGLCCEARCAGVCETCAGPGREGFCDPVPAGQDPADECPTDPVANCGRTGACSGARACQLYSAGTVCTAASCTDSSHSAPADPCNGSGTCVDVGTQSCAPYLCNGATGLCRVSCTSSSDCIPGTFCNGSAQCVPLVADGGACASSGQCQSGACCSNVCRNLLTDSNNCGSCGLACTNAHGTTSCLGATCAPSCSSQWGDCDPSRPNGCEASLTTLSNCGGCGIPCSRANGSASCATGACALTSCNLGYSTCDSNDSNGCEVSHAAYPDTCATAVNLGTYDGDTDCGFICGSNTGWDLFATQTSRSSAWYRARAREDSDCSAYLEHQIRLTVPAGVDYDLYVYRGCGTLVGSSTLGTGLAETVTVSQTDSGPSDDSFDYWVEVRWHSGASCSNWTLQLFGHNC